jgi:hypothetical protein
MVVYNINTDIPLNLMKIGEPSAIQGGSSYRASITINNSPIQVQLPKCTTKAGIIETKRNNYCDLMYNHSEHNLSEWIKQLEEKCMKLIDDKKHLLFSNTLSTNDINCMITPVSRDYKSGTLKLLRVNVGSNSSSSDVKCFFFDEKKQRVDNRCIDTNTSVIPLIIIEGIHFTSRSIDIILKLHQMMVFDAENVNTCLINLENKIADTKIEKHKEVIENDVIENDDVEEVELNSNSLDNDIIVDSVNNNTDDTQYHKHNDSCEEDNDINDINDNYSNNDNSEDDDEIIDIDIEDLNSNNYEMNEVEININDNDDPLTLKRPNDVYYEIYKASIDKAKHMRKVAIEAYIEAQQIKTKYMIIDDDEDDENNKDNIFKNTTDIINYI